MTSFKLTTGTCSPSISAYRFCVCHLYEDFTQKTKYGKIEPGYGYWSNYTGNETGFLELLQKFPPYSPTPLPRDAVLLHTKDF